MLPSFVNFSHPWLVRGEGLQLEGHEPLASDDRNGRSSVETWLRWGLIYFAALMVFLAVMSRRSAPFGRLERLLQAIERIFTTLAGLFFRK